MDRLRIAVIGLGWFGEIHCDAIVGVPNLVESLRIVIAADKSIQTGQMIAI